MSRKSKVAQDRGQEAVKVTAPGEGSRGEKEKRSVAERVTNEDRGEWVSLGDWVSIGPRMVALSDICPVFPFDRKRDPSELRPEELKDLIDSIRERGVETPLLITVDDGDVWLIEGYRRYHALLYLAENSKERFSPDMKIPVLELGRLETHELEVLKLLLEHDLLRDLPFLEQLRAAVRGVKLLSVYYRGAGDRFNDAVSVLREMMPDQEEEEADADEDGGETVYAAPPAAMFTRRDPALPGVLVDIKRQLDRCIRTALEHPDRTIEPVVESLYEARQTVTSVMSYD
jgi:hypothetical protein